MRGGGVCWNMSSTCVQGGIIRPLGGYQPNVIMEPHSPVPGWQMHHPVAMKQEPMEDDRNDSGINSGLSDFHSSSPGSENSQDCNPSSAFSSSSSSAEIQSSVPSQLYSSSVISRIATSGSTCYSNPIVYPAYNPSNGHQQPEVQESPVNFRRSPSLVSTPTNSTSYDDLNSTLTDSTSPGHVRRSHSCESKDSNNAENDDPLHKLQMSLEKSGLVPPCMLSPKTTSEHSADDENKSDGEMDEYDEQGIRVPKVNSHGKIKTFKCKQCDFVAVTKLEFWEHSKAHIKADKLLTCPKCPFVTEYKHHLEYHLRNHFGSKPFKCDKCSYSCVNKSMLNSHMKSHSNIYQYRCADCSYATKYCHSLKLHLRKYSHKPAMVLNPDGTPNPLPIIDVYGTRRGPKQKNFSKQDEPECNPAKFLQNQFAQFVMNAQSQPPMAIPFPYPFLGALSNPLANPLLFKQNLEQLAKERDSFDAENEDESREDEQMSTVSETPPVRQDDTGALDLSKPDNISPSPEQPIKNRRKGRAYKLEKFQESFDGDDDENDDEGALKIDEDAEESNSSSKPDDKEVMTNNNKPGNFSCQYCNIAFGDIVLYTMHMGYHGYKNPFTCNMCGEQCVDKVSFFLHIARNPHT
ncbi:protein hunchback [Agrilus planipennis]|uniref:Protein hunchback n=1 Tax=Agrilus planipennis TaxID=224129 RepID=A0A1W4XM94_AGRPL|nr:protein hunchback [Agrilus planipennis]XP_018333895.1 protein hunchback [Agrilus planipennis]XP_018333897.1 protein hunchback [Agrilus planipennis]